MTDLWLLNKHKIRLAATCISISWSAICVALCTWPSTLKGFPGITPSVTVIFAVLLIALPAILLGIIYADLRYRSKLIHPLFADPPLSQLYSIGFAKIYQHQDSKWLFTTVYWQGLINGFTIKVFTTKHLSGQVLFKTYVKHQTIDKNRFAELTAQLSQKDITFDKASLVKSIPVKTVLNMELTEIQQVLIDFTETLKQENFLPDHI